MRLFLLLLLSILLSGCGPNVVVQSPIQATTTPRPTGQVAVRTLLPAATLMPGKSGLPLGATVYPAPDGSGSTGESQATIYPYPYPAAQAPQEKSSLASAPFHDCARTPGLAGCDPQALILSGSLALIDHASGRLVVLNLSSGKGWQARAYKGLAWSPDASQLLVWEINEGGQQDYLWGADGVYQPDFSQDQILSWQPDGTLAPRDLLRYPGGAEYSLELSANNQVLLHIHPAAGQDQTMTVDDHPADRQYLLLERIPGSEHLLAQSYFPSNLGVSAGGSLLLIDPAKGKVQPLGVDAPLPPEANFAWSPSQPALLAFTASGAEPGMTILSLYDFTTQNFSQPIPRGVQVSSLDWRPDGKRLAFAAEPLPGAISAADLAAFPTAGIYGYDPQSGKVSPLLQAPQGVSIGWVRWSADGKSLIYGRLARNAAGKTLGEVHAFGVDSQRDTLLFNALELSQGPLSTRPWLNILSYAR
jgi:hypothetical protein